MSDDTWIGRRAKRSKAPRMALGEAEIEALAAERRRTGVDVAALYRAIPEPRKGLKPHTIWQWLDGKVKSAGVDHYHMVLETWRSLPDVPQLDGETLGLGHLEMKGNKVVINDAISARLREWQKASGVGALELLKSAWRAGEIIPEGLKARTVTQWIRGETNVARPDHLEFVATRWREAAEREPE